MNVGFTGVIWEARPAERLANDLHQGPGPARLAESGAGWTALATELADIGVEYGKIIADLGMHWESQSYNHAFSKLTQLAPWFADAANHAVETAAKAEEQAAATTVALTAMPNPIELQATKAIHDALAHVHVAAGSPLAAAAATTDHAQQDQKQRAARVMESYERATTPVAKPWFHEKPPQIVSEDALRAEQAAARQASLAQSSARGGAPMEGAGKQGGMPAAAMPAMPGMGGLAGMGGASMPAMPKSQYAATDLSGGDRAAAGSSIETQPSATTGGAHSAGMPMAPAGAAGAQSHDEEHRAADYETPPASAAGANEDVNLPNGWVPAGQHDAPVSWSDVADRYDKPSLPEGVLNLDGGHVAPSVLGSPDEGGQT